MPERGLGKHRKRVAMRDLCALNGIPPYDKSSYVYGDGYFSASLKRKYGMSIRELETVCGFPEYHDKWIETIKTFLEENYTGIPK